MLQRGWMLKYLPERALQHVGDLGVAFGYVWAGLMFFSAVLNLVVAQHMSVLRWAAFMGVYATASKIGAVRGSIWRDEADRKAPLLRAPEDVDDGRLGADDIDLVHRLVGGLFLADKFDADAVGHDGARPGRRSGRSARTRRSAA